MSSAVAAIYELPANDDAPQLAIATLARPGPLIAVLAPASTTPGTSGGRDIANSSTDTITIWEADGQTHCVVNKVFSRFAWSDEQCTSYAAAARGKRVFFVVRRDGVFVRVHVTLPTRAVLGCVRSGVAWLQERVTAFWQITRNAAAVAGWVAFVGFLSGHSVLATGAPSGAMGLGVKAAVCSVVPGCSASSAATITKR